MKIPATVVTGFLGAGKTTLIRHLLENAAGRRLAVVVNEFGDIGVDRELLLGCGIGGCAEDDLIELPNGCICCTVADAFLPTMQRLLDRPTPPDHIVVETSGLALPKPLVKAFQWPDIRSQVTVDGVITVVDGPAVAAGRFSAATEAATTGADGHDQPLPELFADQLACADLVVLNKIDGMDERQLGYASAEVDDRLRPGTKVVLTVRAALDPVVALGLGVAAEDDIDRRRCLHDDDVGEHGHDEFVSFVAELSPVAEPGALEQRIRAVVAEHDVLRVKGFVEVPGRSMRLAVQAVGPRFERYFDRPWRTDEPRCGRLVVIAQKGVDTEAVAAALRG